MSTSAKRFLSELKQAIAGSYRHTQLHHGSRSLNETIELIRRRIERSYALARDQSRRQTPGDVEKVFTNKRMMNEIEEMTRVLNEKHVIVHQENPLDWPLQLALEEFHEAAAKAGMQLPAIPTIGTLPIGDMNAWTMRVPDSEEIVIVVHTGLALFLNRMLKIVLSIHSFTDPTAYASIDRNCSDWPKEFAIIAEEAIRQNPVYEEHFVLGLLFYLAAGDPNLAPPIHVSAIVSGLRASVLHYAEMFIVGHEYVHIMAGDLAQSGTKVRRALGSCDISSCQWDHKSEIAADLTSTCLLATHSADRYLGMNRALHFMNLARTHFKTQLSVNLRHA